MVKFCWDIDDVVHIKLNRQVSVGKKTFTAEMKDQIEELNWADLLLYKHFHSKLDHEGTIPFFYYSSRHFTLVELIGNDRIEEIVSEIRRRSQILEHECIDPTQQIINDEGVVWATMNKNRETNITCWTSTRGRFPSGTISSSSFL